MRKFLLCFLVLLVLSGCASPIVKFDGEIKQQIIDEIRASTKKIDMAVMDLSNPDIIMELQEKAQKIPVQIIIDQRYHKYLAGKFEEGTVWQSRHGRTKSGKMHHKFIIFDGKRVMTGSYNISDRADKRNYENAIFLSGKKVVEEYQKLFDTLWENAEREY